MELLIPFSFGNEFLSTVDQHYRLIAIDMKGFGRSEKENQNFNWHTVASEISDFMKEIHAQRFFIVAQDFGSYIGSVLAHDHQKNILGFIRMDAEIIPNKYETFSQLEYYSQNNRFLFLPFKWVGGYLLADVSWFVDYMNSRIDFGILMENDEHFLLFDFSRDGVVQSVLNYFDPKNWDFNTAISGICNNKFSFPVLQLLGESQTGNEHIASVCPNVKVQIIKSTKLLNNPDEIGTSINNFVKSTIKK